MTEQPLISPSELQAALSERLIIGDVIGAGGQATVYSAELRRESNGHLPGTRIALKLHKVTAEVQRVEREIEALRGLEHPCLARFVEHGTLGTGRLRLLYVAWVYIQGEALDARLSRGPLAPRAVACVGRDVSKAIAHIWTKRIVHRDVNPKNVMLHSDETAAVLIDLGVARFLDKTALTAAGKTWGTWGYLSPEQWSGDNLTCQSDVFALGISLLECLAGGHPVGGDQRMLMDSRLQASRICPKAPAKLVGVVERCLDPRPAFRATPNQLAVAFAEIAGELA